MVEIIEVLPDTVNFAYAGIAYAVARNSVSDISVVPRSTNDFPSPPYAIMTVSHNTQFNTIHSIAASDLVGAIPFSMLGQLEPKAPNVGPSERESEWMSKTKFNAKTLADVAFSSNSATRSGGAADDSGVDDWCHAI
jgi:hypothetical protein